MYCVVRVEFLTRALHELRILSWTSFPTAPPTLNDTQRAAYAPNTTETKSTTPITKQPSFNAAQTLAHANAPAIQATFARAKFVSPGNNNPARHRWKVHGARTHTKKPHVIPHLLNAYPGLFEVHIQPSDRGQYAVVSTPPPPSLPFPLGPPRKRH